MSTPKPKTRRTPEALAQFHADKAKLHARRAAEAKVADNERWVAITRARKALEAIPDRMTFGAEVANILADVIETLETEADRIAGIGEA